MIEVAPLRYGVIFKKVFSKPHIFTAFVKDMLGIEIKIDIVETEKSFSPIVGSVDSRFDLFAQDKENRLIVNIQHKRYEDHYDRFLHYHCVALIEQITSSANYKPDMQVYTIVVLTSGDKHKTDVLITDFSPKKLDGTRIAEIQHKIVYLCPKYVSDKTPKPYQEWLKAINDSLDRQVEESDYQNEVIQEVFSLIKKDKISPQECARMKDEYSDEEYLQEQAQKAMKEGMEKGMKKGMEKGMEKGVSMVAKKMKEAQVATETIMEATGLSIEQIEKL
ncbi:Rpn family recombination-promoting nuclease/putative transposase [Candidatus Parabeggiatoa sp. HSG14]|uniref:Rpn family recombination-promoting nuclease/putative transposase n=1 Tax=Candidatus Parabeggiatoa sp. HSG14 TaxID=3055593 RepID=UPI0025A8CFD8|nr:Rpn family recombination-promoting nuclease/putative transposase [Thiotrichales bacterium HSG14]